MNSLPPFALLKRQLRVKPDKQVSRVDVSYDEALDILRLLLRGVPVDEIWYLNEYPDVAAAVAIGNMRSARLHFIASGYFEGRLPVPLRIDEAWYLSEYPDVGDGLARGDFDSADQHFRKHGYEEGRLPAPD